MVVLLNAAFLKRRYDTPRASGGFTAPLTIGRVDVTALYGVATSVALLVVYVSTHLVEGEETPRANSDTHPTPRFTARVRRRP